MAKSIVRPPSGASGSRAPSQGRNGESPDRAPQSPPDDAEPAVTLECWEPTARAVKRARTVDLARMRRYRQFLATNRDREGMIFGGYGATLDHAIAELVEIFKGSDGSNGPYDTVVWDGEYVVAVVCSHDDGRGSADVIRIEREGGTAGSPARVVAGGPPPKPVVEVDRGDGELVQDLAQFGAGDEGPDGEPGDEDEDDPSALTEYRCPELTNRAHDLREAVEHVLRLQREYDRLKDAKDRPATRDFEENLWGLAGLALGGAEHRLAIAMRSQDVGAIVAHGHLFVDQAATALDTADITTEQMVVVPLDRVFRLAE